MTGVPPGRRYDRHVAPLPRAGLVHMLRDGPLVYVAGPIGADESRWDAHLRDALYIAEGLLLAGACPFVPHLHGIVWTRMVGPQPTEVWLAYDEGVLRSCDALVRMEGTSPGADREETFARGVGIPVLYSWDEIDQFLRDWAPRDREDT